ncbi:MAG: hypothetical protein PGN25_06760 [Methylorubrum populi]
MLKALFVAALVSSMAGGAALAQSAATPSGTMPVPDRGITDTPAATGTAQPARDPNAAGLNKIDGLEVPQMKDPQAGGPK